LIKLLYSQTSFFLQIYHVIKQIFLTLRILLRKCSKQFLNVFKNIFWRFHRPYVSMWGFSFQTESNFNNIKPWDCEKIQQRVFAFHLVTEKRHISKKIFSNPTGVISLRFNRFSEWSSVTTETNSRCFL